MHRILCARDSKKTPPDALSTAVRKHVQSSAARLSTLLSNPQDPSRRHHHCPFIIAVKFLKLLPELRVDCMTPSYSLYFDAADLTSATPFSSSGIIPCITADVTPPSSHAVPITALVAASTFFRFTPLSLSSHFPKQILNTHKFVALSAQAAESGIGDFVTSAAEEQFSPTAVVLPSFEPCRMLAVGRNFPIIDFETGQILSSSSSSSSSSSITTAANQHLAHLRIWFSRIVARSLGTTSDQKTIAGDVDEHGDVPDSLIPRDCQDVAFWCAVSYPPTASRAAALDDGENSGVRSGDLSPREVAIRRSKFLLPSSLLWKSVTVCPDVVSCPRPLQMQLTDRLSVFASIFDELVDDPASAVVHAPSSQTCDQFTHLTLTTATAVVSTSTAAAAAATAVQGENEEAGQVHRENTETMEEQEKQNPVATAAKKRAAAPSNKKSVASASAPPAQEEVTAAAVAPRRRGRKDN